MCIRFSRREVGPEGMHFQKAAAGGASVSSSNGLEDQELWAEPDLLFTVFPGPNTASMQ